MIGTINPQNNDVYLYLSPNEISRLDQEQIVGDYVGFEDDVLGKLTLKLEDDLRKMSDVGQYRLDKSDDNTIKNIDVKIYRGKYGALKERGIELHLGYSHIHVENTDSLDFGHSSNHHLLLLARERIMAKNSS